MQIIYNHFRIDHPQIYQSRSKKDSYLKRDRDDDIRTDGLKCLPPPSHCGGGRPSPPGQVQGPLSIQWLETNFSPGQPRRPFQKKRSAGSIWNAHQGSQPSTFLPKGSEFPFTTISLVIENQESTIFSEEETWTLPSFHSQDCGPVVLEGTRPTHFTELDTEAQRSEGLPRGHTAGQSKAGTEA